MLALNVALLVLLALVLRWIGRLLVQALELSNR